MATLEEIRQQYPQYNDMPDAALADALHTKFYSDIPRQEFDQKIGLASSKPVRGLGQRLSDLWENPPAGGLVSTIIKPFVEGATAPGDVLAGKLDPMGEGRYDAAHRMAGLASVATLATAPGGPWAVPRGALTSGLVPRAAPAVAADAAKSGSQEIIAAGNRINTPIPKFLATEDMTTQRLAAGLRNIPGAGDKIVKATQQTTDALGSSAKQLSESLGTGSQEVAGSAAKDAITGWVTDGSKKVASRLYDAVDPLVDQSFTRELHATRNAVSEIMAKRANSKIPGKSPAVGTVMDAVQSGGLNYEGIKGLRTFIGDMTPQEMVAKGIAPKEAERLYAAMTEDLKGTILDAGGPQALAAFEKANGVFDMIAARRKALGKIVGMAGDAAPEAVFSRLVSYAGSKSSADIGRLMSARKAMGQEAWSEVASAVVSKLGRDPQGNFSADRFFTAYGNLAPAAKSALFKTGKENVGRSLDDINTVVKGIREKVTRFGNPSGTAQNLIGASMAGMVFTDPTHILKALAGLVGGNAMATALAKPAQAKAIANYVKATRSSSPLAMQAAARSLAVALGNPNLAPKLHAITQSRGEDQQVPAGRM